MLVLILMKVAFCIYSLFLVFSFVAVSQNEDLAKIKNYAENIEPSPVDANDTTFGIILPVPSDAIVKALKKSYKKDKKEVEKYVVLVMLKLYAEQVRCCHKAFQIWGDGCTEDKEPLTYYYLKITNECNPDKKNACLPFKSSMSYLWVMKNSSLLDYAPIKAEMDYITALKKNN